MAATTLSRQGGRRHQLGNFDWSSAYLPSVGYGQNPTLLRRRGILTSGVQYAETIPNRGTVAPQSGTVRKIRPVVGTSGTLYANRLPSYGSGGAAR